MPLITTFEGDGCSLAVPRRGRHRVFGGWVVHFRIGNQEGNVRITLMTKKRFARMTADGLDPSWSVFKCGGMRVTVKVEPVKGGEPR